MPIHYACVLNARFNVVLQGMYEKTATNFKPQVTQNANRIQRFQYSEVPLPQTNLKIMYHNWDTATAAMVVSHEVDRQECGEFMEQFKLHIEQTVLGKTSPGYEAPTMNASGDASEIYKPLQASTAESTFRQFQPKVDAFINTWNDDPSNRSKIGQLREQLEETKAVVLEDLELTVKRGQLLEDTKQKSESLVNASSVMKKRSKEVKMKMCCRKYMYYIIGILVTIGLGLFLYLILS